jgi:signal transduction histidine kinase
MLAPLRLGLRLRIAVAFAIACALVVGAIGITLFGASENLEQKLIDQIIDEELNHIIARYRQEPDFVPQSTSNFEAYIVRTPGDLARLPLHLRGIGAGRHKLFRGPDEIRVAVRLAGDAHFYVAYDVGLHEQRVREFKFLILVSLIVAAAIALALGYLLSGLLAKQVTDLAARVNSLVPEPAGDALAQPGQDEEVAQLARALDDYRARIARMVQREQEFTANANHELRTPLTAIKTSCELLAADPGLNDKARSRVAAISRAGERMTDQLQALLFLAREQGTDDSEPVLLIESVNHAAEPYRIEIERKGLQFEIAIGGDAVLDLNRQALHLVLANLIKNAVRYTEHGSIRISYAARRLTVADSGIGIAPDHLPHVFERFYRGDRGAEGIGLGLAIVKGICDHFNWKIDVRSRPEQGSEFSVTFP